MEIFHPEEEEEEKKKKADRQDIENTLLRGTTEDGLKLETLPVVEAGGLLFTVEMLGALKPDSSSAQFQRCLNSQIYSFLRTN